MSKGISYYFKGSEPNFIFSIKHLNNFIGSIQQHKKRSVKKISCRTFSMNRKTIVRSSHSNSDESEYEELKNVQHGS
jgi:hypothetical protein